MKKILSIIALLFVFANANSQAPACCPEFSMTFKRDRGCIEKFCSSNAPVGVNSYTASMCKYSTNSFLVVPNLPGYTYSWVVTGGTPSNATGNPVSITWGGGNTGTITVTITSADSSCIKTITEIICLRDAPIAAFTFNPNGACAGIPITFTNNSVGGASTYWDFGDGNFALNPSNPVIHSYANPGTYVVTIYVSNDTADCRETAGGGQPPQHPCCGCVTSYSQTVTVSSGSPLTIVPKDCINQCLCAGDTATYCISVPCSGPITWTVSPGSTILSGQGTSCVTVIWGNTYPTTISVSAPNCGNPCGNTATLSVPVLVNNIPISPNISPVCQNTTQAYSLPAMPGVFYNWTVTGGTIVGPNINTPVITVMWGMGPTGSVSCTYSNPLKKNCKGTSSLNVTIRPVLKVTGPSETCVGCTAFFFANGPGPITWSSSTAGVSFSPVTGLSTTVSFPVSATTNTYNIIATAPAGVYCNSPVTSYITVAPRPVLTMVSIPSPAIACPNTPVKFVVTSTVTTTPISWLPLPSGATMIANTGPQLDTAIISFSSIPPGGVVVTATQNCAYNLPCSQGSASVTVNKPPAPVLNSPVINPCIDQAVGYSVVSPVAGVTYTWAITNNLGTITTGQGTGSITVLWHGNNAAGNAGVLSVTTCGGTATVNITVTLPVFPTITRTGSCFPATLTSSTAGPYLWSGPGVTGQTTASVTITQAGTYTVTINSGSPGSCAQTKTIIIPPNPYFVRIIPPCVVSSCNPATLSVLLTVVTNIPGATNCQWWFQPVGGGGYSLLSTSCANLNANLPGSYYLVIQDPNGCFDTSNIIRIPQDVNICCASPACAPVQNTNFIFTHSGCQPTVFTGTPLVLPPGWTKGTLRPTICYGDGTSDDFNSLNTTHQYQAAGLYTACVVQKVVNISTNDTCCINTCRQVIIPVVTRINGSYNCNTGLMTINDNSTFYPNSTGAIVSWTYAGGTYTGSFINTPNQTQTLTPTSSGLITITLTVVHNGCTSVATTQILVVMPVAPITINPNPSCHGSPVFFSTVSGMASYLWNFGDSSFSYLAGPQHTYPAPGTYTVTLTATTIDGCVIVTTGAVTIQLRPIVTISPNPITICPGLPVTLTATINANGNTMCPNLTDYTIQWYNNGNPVGGNTPTLTTTNYGTYYAVLTGINPCNCVIRTDTALVLWYPKPVAKIKGKSTVCISGGSGSVNLVNSVSGYTTYNWSSNNPPNISFSPLNNVSTTVTILTAGNYQIYLQVIDANGCMAYDTLCIYATNSPTVSVNTPGGTLCAGNIYNLTASPVPATAPPAGYGYLWSNGSNTPSVSVSAPGVHNVIVTDLNSGCSAISNSVVINKGPDLRLFPSCCDTICSDAPINISIPLPLITGQNICSTYNIIWLDNNVPISPQPSPCNILNTATLLPLLGMHNLSIVVTINGCTDTSNVFSLFIKDCSCDCKESKWDKITLTPGSPPKDDDNPAAAKIGIPDPNPNPANLALNCGKTYKLDCNKPYTINAGYFCKDSICADSVTYSLQPPIGAALTGSIPPALTFTPTLNGIYTLTLYGWCGDKICDTCIIKFEVKCVECDCKGSKWGEQTVTINNNTKSFKCGDVNDVKCKQPITVNANYLCADQKCNPAVTYSLQGPTSSTGTLPLTFTPLLSGTYTLTMYGWCGTTICDSCVIIFKAVCEPEDCCPYKNITATTGTVKYDYTQIPNATVAAQTFTINGLALASITEVRANVVSYTIDDNYKGDCMKCVNLPFTWASIASAANIGAAPGLITMYGGTTVASFNGSGTGAYKNPREVIWNNGSPISIPNGTNIGMNFILPPVPAIDCCELKGKICVKFTFRDKDCKECEVIVCFDFVIKKK